MHNKLFTTTVYLRTWHVQYVETIHRQNASSPRPKSFSDLIVNVYSQSNENE